MASRIIKSQGALSIQTESSDLTLNPQGNVIVSKPLDITANGLSAALPVAYGGTGASSASAARTALGCQAYSARLDEIAALAPSNGEHLEWNGSAWVAATHNEEATTAAAPLTLTSGEVGISLDSGNLEVNGSNELAIKAGGVGTTELSAAAVTDAKISNETITANSLASNCVTTAKINNGAVTSAKLDSGVFTNPSFGLSSTMTSSNANASSSSHAFYVATSNATETAVALGDLTDNEVYLFDCYVAARDQTTGDAACYKAHFAASAAAGSASIHGTTNVEVVYEAAGASAWQVDFDNNGSAGIECNVTGDSANAVHWNVTVNRVRVA